jgi:hypothetical protein
VEETFPPLLVHSHYLALFKLFTLSRKFVPARFQTDKTLLNPEQKALLLREIYEIHI